MLEAANARSRNFWSSLSRMRVLFAKRCNGFCALVSLNYGVTDEIYGFVFWSPIASDHMYGISIIEKWAVTNVKHIHYQVANNLQLLCRKKKTRPTKIMGLAVKKGQN